MSEARQTASLLRTPLYRFHVERGARFIAFAGYEMPVQYSTGILTEHLHTRAAAGLFDISHMGQIAVCPMSRRLEDAARALETLVPIDVIGISEERQRYALFTNAAGGVLDDLIVANRGDHLVLVVNAACKTADLAHLRRHLGQVCKIELLPDRALIALQTAKFRGPAIPAKTDLRSASRLIALRAWRMRYVRTIRCCRSVLARATLCGWKPDFVSTGPISIRLRRR